MADEYQSYPGQAGSILEMLKGVLPDGMYQALSMALGEGREQQMLSGIFGSGFGTYIPQVFGVKPLTGVNQMFSRMYNNSPAALASVDTIQRGKWGVNPQTGIRERQMNGLEHAYMRNLLHSQGYSNEDTEREMARQAASPLDPKMALVSFATRAMTREGNYAFMQAAGRDQMAYSEPMIAGTWDPTKKSRSEHLAERAGFMRAMGKDIVDKPGDYGGLKYNDVAKEIISPLEAAGKLRSGGTDKDGELDDIGKKFSAEIKERARALGSFMDMLGTTASETRDILEKVYGSDQITGASSRVFADRERNFKHTMVLSQTSAKDLIAMQAASASYIQQSGYGNGQAGAAIGQAAAMFATNVVNVDGLNRDSYRAFVTKKMTSLQSSADADLITAAFAGVLKRDGANYMDDAARDKAKAEALNMSVAARAELVNAQGGLSELVNSGAGVYFNKHEAPGSVAMTERSLAAGAERGSRILSMMDSASQAKLAAMTPAERDKMIQKMSGLDVDTLVTYAGENNLSFAQPQSTWTSALSAADQTAKNVAGAPDVETYYQTLQSATSARERERIKISRRQLDRVLGEHMKGGSGAMSALIATLGGAQNKKDFTTVNMIKAIMGVTTADDSTLSALTNNDNLKAAYAGLGSDSQNSILNMMMTGAALDGELSKEDKVKLNNNALGRTDDGSGMLSKEAAAAAMKSWAIRSNAKDSEAALFAKAKGTLSKDGAFAAMTDGRRDKLKAIEAIVEGTLNADILNADDLSKIYNQDDLKSTLARNIRRNKEAKGLKGDELEKAVNEDLNKAMTGVTMHGREFTAVDEIATMLRELMLWVRQFWTTLEAKLNGGILGWLTGRPNPKASDKKER